MSERVDCRTLNRAAQAATLACLCSRFDGSVPSEATPLSELCLDSLELIEILFELERCSGLSLSNAELDELSNVGDLMRCFGISQREQGGER